MHESIALRMSIPRPESYPDGKKTPNVTPDPSEVMEPDEQISTVFLHLAG
jgi:hypothetical protein